jgi:hypothetical protein
MNTSVSCVISPYLPFIIFHPTSRQNVRISEARNVLIGTTQHHSQEICPHTSKPCMLKYVTRNDLIANVHVYVQSNHLSGPIKALHVKIRDINCPPCGYAAAFSGNLSAHIKRVPEKIRDKKCLQCDYASARSTPLCLGISGGTNP